MTYEARHSPIDGAVPHVSLVSTAAAKELRDCYFAPMVRKFIWLGSDEGRSTKQPKIGI